MGTLKDEDEIGRVYHWGDHHFHTGWDDDQGDPLLGFTHYYLPPGGIPEVRTKLIADATAKLPPNTRFELRRQIPGSYGRAHGMAWYRAPYMDKEPEWNKIEPREEGALFIDKGYIFIGQYTTPA